MITTYRIKHISLTLKTLMLCGALSVLILVGNYWLWQQKEQSVIDLLAERMALLNQTIEAEWQSGFTYLRQDIDALRLYGEAPAFRKRMAKSSDASNGLFRLNLWNADGDLLIKSTQTASDFTLNIFGRAYFQQSLKHPDAIVLAGPFAHIESARPIFVAASAHAIQSSAPNYVLSLVFPIDEWQARFSPSSGDCLCEAQWQWPKGGILPANATMPSPRLTLSRSQASVEQRGYRYLRQGIYQILLLWLAGLAVYALFRRNLHRQTSALLAAHPPTPIRDPLHAIELASQLQHALQEELRETQAQLQHRTKEKQRILASFLAESQQAHRVIQTYSDYLEEASLHQKLDAQTMYDYDDVRETGEQLSLLASCFRSFTECQHKPPISATLLQAESSRVLGRMQPWLERRNMSARLVWHLNPGCSAQFPAQLPQLMHLALFLALRYGEDESVLGLQISPCDTEGLNITLDVSRYRQSTLPPAQQDFRAFGDAFARDMASAMLTRIAQDTNWQVIESFTQLLHGNARLEVKDQGFRVRLHLPAEQEHPLLGE